MIGCDILSARSPEDYLELAAVVDQGVAMSGVAARTERGLSNAAALHLHVGLGFAHGATEERLGYLGNEVGGSGHHSRDCDELVNVWGSEPSFVLTNFKQMDLLLP